MLLLKQLAFVGVIATLFAADAARVDEVWSDPLNWGEPAVVAYGGKHRIWDSGNANAVEMNGRHYVTYYAGNETYCRVLVAEDR